MKELIALALVVVAAPSLSAPKKMSCENTDGSVAGRKVTIEFEPPADSKYDAKHCAFELGAPMSVAMVNVIHQDDSGPEKLLNEKEDGAQKWVLKLSGGSLKPVSTEKVTLLGVSETLYRLTGEFHGAKDAEVLVARVKVGTHNVVFMSQYPAKESAKWGATAKAVFVSTGVKIDPAP